LSLDIAALQRLREAAERVKCELSGTTESLASVPFIASGASGPLHLNYTLTREWLNELIRPLFPRLLECCRCALEDARLKRNELSNVLLVGGSTRIPAVQELVKEFFGREPSRTLNPDEAVAIGAAIQGAIISGGLREVLLLDVTPLSLGIETEGGLFSVIIPRNSSIPVAVHKQFTTVRDNQTSVKIHVLQGERRVAAENHSLGWFRLEGITPAPKEIPAIDVCFQIDANGLLHVSATEVTSGISNSITIHSFTQVTPEQAEEMVAAAQAAADQDLLHIRKQALRRMADEIIDGLTRILENQERPLDPLTAQNIRETIFKFDVAFSRGELPEIERAYEMLKELGDMFSSRILSQRLETLEDPSAG